MKDAEAVVDATDAEIAEGVEAATFAIFSEDAVDVAEDAVGTTVMIVAEAGTVTGKTAISNILVVGF